MAGGNAGAAFFNQPVPLNTALGIAGSPSKRKTAPSAAFADLISDQEKRPRTCGRPRPSKTPRASGSFSRSIHREFEATIALSDNRDVMDLIQILFS
jgi:hypothetical protein